MAALVQVRPIPASRKEMCIDAILPITALMMSMMIQGTLVQVMSAPEALRPLVLILTMPAYRPLTVALARVRLIPAKRSRISLPAMARAE